MIKIKKLISSASLITLFLLSIFPKTILAQDCNTMLKGAINEKKKNNYELAIKKLIAAKNCDENLSKKTDSIVIQIFREIEALKRKAEKAQQKAYKQELIAIKEKENAEKATKEANRLREMAESNAKPLQTLLINTYGFVIKNELIDEFSDWLVKSNDTETLMPIIDVLIQYSQSMTEEEKAYWYNLSKSMTTLQHIKLMNILGKELSKLDRIEKLYKELEIGDQFYKNEEYSKALGIYLQIKEDYPSFSSPNIKIIKTYAAYNNYEKAEAYVLELEKPNSISDGYSTMGKVFYKVQNYNDALKSHLNAIDYNHMNSSAFFSAGMDYYQLQHYEKAKEYFEKAYGTTQEKIITDSLNYHLYFNLSWYSLFASKPQEAITAAKKALELAPDKTSAYTNLVSGYVLNNEYEKAKPIYLKWKDMHFPNEERLCKEVFLQDIKDLKESGISHEDFNKVIELLK